MPTFLKERTNRRVYVEDVSASIGQSMGAMYGVMGFGEAFAHEEQKHWLQRFDASKLTEDEIKTRVGELPLKVDPGISESRLELEIEAKQKELRRNRIMSRARDDVAASVLHFTAGLASSLTDPGDLLVSLVPVVGPARYAAMLEKATTATSRALLRARIGAAGGVAGTAAIEPFMYGFAQSRQEQYTLQNSFLNIVFGGIMGGGLHAAGGFVADRYFRPPVDSPTARVVDNLAPETNAEALRTAVAQFGTGNRVDVIPVLSADPRYSYVSRTTVVEPPEGVGGGRKGTQTLQEQVKSVLEKEIQDREISVKAQYDNAILARGDIQKLKEEQRVLTQSIAKSQAEIARRSVKDDLRIMHEGRLRKEAPRLKEVQRVLKEQDLLRTKRGKQVSEVDRARNALMQPEPDLKNMPEFLRTKLDETLEGIHRAKGNQLLKDAMALHMRQKNQETSSITMPREESALIQKQVDTFKTKTESDFLEEILPEMEKELNAIGKEIDITQERVAIQKDIKEMETEFNEMQEAMSKWLNCRSING